MNDNTPFTKIPNNVLNKIISSKLNGTQYAIVFAIARATWGFHEESRILGINFFVNTTQRNRYHIANELKKLIHRNIIIVEQIQTFNTSRELSLNENIHDWLPE